ncbi:MAG: hypothetical protein JNJ46_04425 [Myxococcales bacterium]|nr:hypothetical protein [Myxococcales bacterium]
MFQLKAWLARAAERLIPSQAGLASHDTLSLVLFTLLLVLSFSLVTYVCLKESNHPDK